MDKRESFHSASLLTLLTLRAVNRVVHACCSIPFPELRYLFDIIIMIMLFPGLLQDTIN